MSAAIEREILLPDKLNTELICKLQEIIESLVDLNKLTIDVLAQYINVEEYEHMISKILSGDDAIIK
ncbi:MAG: hypothetical protein IJT37_10205 [Lachnospiraceae bacterium]|nr:hypothetical protein [Lachnospiraceae bacterium]